MANRNFPSQKQFGFHLMPVRLDGTITIGASGAVASFSALGVNAITKTATGVYQIQLQDNYSSFLSMEAHMIGTVSGSAIDPNTASAGSLYQITTVGTTTNWTTAGVPSGITPAVGQTFALASAPAAGDGRVKLFVPSAVTDIQPLGNQNAGFLSNQPFQAGSGGYVTFVTRAATNSTTTTMIPTNPASGETIVFELLLNNSAVQ